MSDYWMIYAVQQFKTLSNAFKFFSIYLSFRDINILMALNLRILIANLRMELKQSLKCLSSQMFTK
jgi:hypothetical protein